MLSLLTSAQRVHNLPGLMLAPSCCVRETTSCMAKAWLMPQLGSGEKGLVFREGNTEQCTPKQNMSDVYQHRQLAEIKH